jgi:hypothetical protein
MNWGADIQCDSCGVQIPKQETFAAEGGRLLCKTCRKFEQKATPIDSVLVEVVTEELLAVRMLPEFNRLAARRRALTLLSRLSEIMDAASAKL